MALDNLPRFAAVGAGRMGRGIAIAFAYAGHRISLIDLRVRSDEAWLKLKAEALAEIQTSLMGLSQLGVIAAAHTGHGRTGRHGPGRCRACCAAGRRTGV